MRIEDIDPAVFLLYDDYAHNKLSRRAFMDQLQVYAVGSLTVPAILKYLLPDYENKQQILVDDPRLDTVMMEYDSPKGGGTIKAQLSQPAGNTSKLPGIVVVHENRGLNPHIADVGRRAALAGFISISPDALTPLGGYPGNDDDGRTMQRKRDRGEMLEDFIAAYEYLKNHQNCTGNVGVVGFCFGGSISNLMAAKCPGLKASVPFYGGQAPLEMVPDIQAPLLLQFAENDERVNAGREAYEAALTENGKVFQSYIYPGTQHGFHNDTTPRYNEEQAKLAWKRTIDFFNKHLK